MLIPINKIIEVLIQNRIAIGGVLHIGAHECEELGFYNHIGIQNNNIIWIDAIDEKVKEATDKGIPNIFNAVITDKDDDTVIFNISNNVQSSSVLEFGTHATEHPHVTYVKTIEKQTVTIDTFFKRNNLDASKYNFWNFDIQGAELMALKGAPESIKHATVLYLEVNEKELYKGCGLMPEIDEYLSKYNFKRVITNITQWGWGDALYIKSV